MMKIVVLIAVLAVSGAAQADDFPLMGRCSKLIPSDQEKVSALGGTFTEKAAFEAHREIERRLALAPKDLPAFPSAKMLTEQVEGWLFKKEWLAAKARREHDADEGVAYCEFLLGQYNYAAQQGIPADRTRPAGSSGR
jgi:hypothetical protein